MAIYHCTTKTFSRSKGQSTTAAAAYRTGAMLFDERTGEHHDYRRRSGVEHTAIFAPANAPDWMRDRAQLWNRAEAAERYKNAVIAREIEVALPHELKPEQRHALAERYGHYLSTRYGVAVELAIHAPHRSGDKRNHHAHYLLTTRQVNETGFTGKAELELSDKKKKQLGLQTGRQQVKEIRQRWADHANRALKKAGLEIRIDARSFKDQGITDRAPTSHLGVAANEMERRGAQTRIGNENRAARAFNRLQAQAKALHEKIAREQKQAVMQAQQRTRFEAWAAKKRGELHSKQMHDGIAFSRRLDACYKPKEQTVRDYYQPGITRDLRALKAIEARQQEQGVKGWWQRQQHRDDQEKADALKKQIEANSARRDEALETIAQQRRDEEKRFEQAQAQERADLEALVQRTSANSREVEGLNVFNTRAAGSRQPEREQGRSRGGRSRVRERAPPALVLVP